MKYRHTIFLTGFPGFIAARLVARLANSDTKFFLLVQPTFVEKAMRELEKIAAANNVSLKNFALVEGDITLENLGIDEKDLAAVQAETTDVYHLAAVYDLSVEKDLAFRVNVEGTRNVNDFVVNIKNLHRYNYISTCYVAGKRTGEILETELEHGAGFRNFYEETKYLAELEVERLKEKIPVTVYRPSVVVGDSETGETAKYDGIYSLINYLRKAPNLLRIVNVGNSAVKLNLVPVDFVVEAISTLARDPLALGKTIQLADPEPLTTRELFNSIARWMGGRQSRVTIPAALVQTSLMLPLAPRISDLPHAAVPYFFLKQTYDTSESTALLSPHGVSCPPFNSYVDKIVDFAIHHPVL